MYVIRVSGTGYAYSAKLQSQTSTATQAGIKFLTHTNLEASAPQKSKAGAPSTTTMTYTTGDQLLYTATSGTYIASVPDVPTESKTTNFNFAAIPTSAIPAGNFTMGSPLTEVNRSTNETQYPVTLTAFRMSKYEITNAQYAAFLNAKSIASNGIWGTAPVYNTQTLIVANSSWGLTYSGTQWVPVTGYENAPVINVTWYGATEYATYIGGTLPTEAQWEYACRAGTITPFNTGDFLTNLQANYNWAYPYNGGTNTVTTYPGKTQTVGTYAANTYGLSDMHGNVWEWCSDWYGTYPTTAQTNPTGATTGSSRVIRGGSWYFSAQCCRSAVRYHDYPGDIDYGIGFRVVLVP
jgi:formylglycine-generating enzyme required for sulfatase activity